MVKDGVNAGGQGNSQWVVEVLLADENIGAGTIVELFKRLHRTKVSGTAQTVLGANMYVHFEDTTRIEQGDEPETRLEEDIMCLGDWMERECANEGGKVSVVTLFQKSSPLGSERGGNNSSRGLTLWFVIVNLTTNAILPSRVIVTSRSLAYCGQ